VPLISGSSSPLSGALPATSDFVVATEPFLGVLTPVAIEPPLGVFAPRVFSTSILHTLAFLERVPLAGIGFTMMMTSDAAIPLWCVVVQAIGKNEEEEEGTRRE
jgi:hypothetical protein